MRSGKRVHERLHAQAEVARERHEVARADRPLAASHDPAQDPGVDTRLPRQLRRGQLQRMKEGTCNQEACILYSELLTDFERIGDHVLNIAEELTKAQTGL